MPADDPDPVRPRTHRPVLTSSFLLAVLAAGGLSFAGCTINDPNHNDKIRYSMAMIHAERVLKDAGSPLDIHKD